MDNELNLIKTIFNWYLNCEYYENESHLVTMPVRPYHHDKGFVLHPNYRERAISLSETFPFFDALKQPFRDLAMLQFFTASRISEISGLQWKRVDFDRERLIIKETSYWDRSSKVFVKLNPIPKNKEARTVHITSEILEILTRRKAGRIDDNDFVFNFLGKPLNYCTIQVNYRSAQRKAGISVTGSHNLRHGMATLARSVGGSLDDVIAMTGHKDLKLADHYSRLDDDEQKNTSLKIIAHIRDHNPNNQPPQNTGTNVVSLSTFRKKG